VVCFPEAALVESVVVAAVLVAPLIADRVASLNQ